MSDSLSADTQVALLLTAPMIPVREASGPQPLSNGEYNRLCGFLASVNHAPGDLLSDGGAGLVERQTVTDRSRLEQLLERGFLLSQAVEHWLSRAIQVVGRTDSQYPARVVQRLKEHAPPILYVCGRSSVLDDGGLAIVGSRDAGEFELAYTARVAALAAEASLTVVSGGARGIDAAAMRAALEHGGKSVGVLADKLERAALAPEHRDLLMDDRLVLLSPFDPAAGFNVGNAMQRNKLIYALADAALVVNSDFEKGGTWAGATEQLKKFQCGPLYVRSQGAPARGLEGLKVLGAAPWPNPTTPDELMSAVHAPPTTVATQRSLKF